MVTVEKLDEIIKDMFLSYQLNKIGWGDLSDDDKKAVLNNAIDEINSLQYIGHKADEFQEFAFPRIVNGELLDVDCGVDKAIAQYCFDYLRLNNDETIDKIRSGITSIKIEGASESYDVSKVDFNSLHVNYRKYLNGLMYRGGGC